MSLTLNMITQIAGGGGISAYAYVVVNHAAADTVTATNYDDIIALSSTMALVLVSDSAATCTVTAGQTSRTVSISQGESYYVDLTGVLHLYSAGNQFGWTPTGWQSDQLSTSHLPSITYNQNNLYLLQDGAHSGVVYHTTAIDMTSYSELKAVGSFTFNTTSGNGLYILPNLTQGNYYPAKATLSTPVSSEGAATLTIDVSSLTGEYYVALGIRYSGSKNSEFTITEVSMV